MIASLLGIVALIFALAWFARRTGWSAKHRTQAMRVLGTQTLGSHRAALALVQVDDTRLMLGVTATQINVLHVWPAAENVSSAGAHEGAFRAVLHAQQEP